MAPLYVEFSVCVCHRSAKGKLCELVISLFINFPKCVRSIVGKQNVSVTVRESVTCYMCSSFIITIIKFINDVKSQQVYQGLINFF